MPTPAQDSSLAKATGKVERSLQDVDEVDNEFVQVLSQQLGLDNDKVLDWFSEIKTSGKNLAESLCNQQIKTPTSADIKHLDDQIISKRPDLTEQQIELLNKTIPPNVRR